MGDAVEIAPGITVDKDVRFGKPVIKGTRIGVAEILGYLAAGDSVDELAQLYEIPRESVLAAIAYAAEIVSNERVRAF
jgi:uncharacterized protein (DUF433 family)